MLEQDIIFAEKYKIAHLIGKGGMGSVYLAEDICNHTDYAIKEEMINRSNEQLLRQEAAILLKLNHPLLPKAYQVFEQDNKFYIVMEQLVRNTLNKAEGEITDIDCEQLTTLDSYDLRTDGMDYNEYRALKIHSLGDLKFFSNLGSFYLYEQSEIADYSCIALCPLLRQLYMRNCKITNVDFLLEVPSLTALYLPDNQLTDINQIVQNKNLRYLDISENPINDVSRVTNLEKLYSLSFDVDQTKDMSFLLQFDNLTNLTVYRHDETDLSIIGQLTGLESLTIDYDYQENENYNDRVFITDISYIENLKNLEYLRISCLEDLSQVNSLKELQNLQDLYLYNRKNDDPEKDETIIKDLQQVLPHCNIQY